MKKGICLNIGLDINFNDPSTIETALLRVAHAMLEQKDRDVQMTGLFMKAQAGALAASLADIYRQYGDDEDFGAGDILQAALNCWSQAFGIMLSQSVRAGHEDAAIKDSGRFFESVVGGMVRAVCRNELPKDFEIVEYDNPATAH